MASEDGVQEKEMVGQTDQGGAGAEKKSSAPNSLGKTFSDIRQFFLKSKGTAKDAKATKPETKKVKANVPPVFNAQKIDLKLINQVLVVLLIGLVLLLIYTVFRQRPDISTVMSSVSKIKIVPAESKEITVFNKVSFYLDQLKTRDIFNVFQEKKEPVKVVEVVKEAPPPPPPPPKVTIQEKAKSFKLIGISWGNNPKAIIRNISDQSMLFVRKGDVIEGTDLTVKEILKEEVVIMSEGEEMSML